MTTEKVEKELEKITPGEVARTGLEIAVPEAGAARIGAELAETKPAQSAIKTYDIFSAIFPIFAPELIILEIGAFIFMMLILILGFGVAWYWSLLWSWIFAVFIGYLTLRAGQNLILGFIRKFL
jgi:hypothetical protein